MVLPKYQTLNTIMKISAGRHIANLMKCTAEIEGGHAG